MNDIVEYAHFIERAKAAAENEGCTLPQWELKLWSKPGICEADTS